MPKHTLEQKINALNAIKQSEKFSDTMQKYDVSAYALKRWQQEEDALRREYRQQLRAEAEDKMAQVQHQMADKSLELIQAIDVDRITKAPLNQLATTLGVLIDRFLKLHDTEMEIDTDENTAERIIRIEYYDATTGTVSTSPPWARNHSESSGTLQGRGVRQTLRQDDDGAGYRNGKSVGWNAGMVARADLSNGESGLAGFEDSDDERDWYHD